MRQKRSKLCRLMKVILLEDVNHFSVSNYEVSITSHEFSDSIAQLHIWPSLCGKNEKEVSSILRKIRTSKMHNGLIDNEVE